MIIVTCQQQKILTWLAHPAAPQVCGLSVLFGVFSLRSLRQKNAMDNNDPK